MRRTMIACILGCAAVACDGGSMESDAGPDASTDASIPPVDAHVADGGAPDGGPPPDTLRIERWGERLYGPVLAMSRIDRELWIGTAAVIDPSLGETSPVRSALARLDLDTGVVRAFEAELPRVAGGPTPTAMVVADGARRLVASMAGLLVIEGDTVTHHALEIEGAPASPTHLALDREGGRARLFASTDQGLLEVDPDALTVRSRIALDALGGMPGSLAIDPASGALFAAVHPDASASFVLRILGEERTRLVPGEGGVPSGAVGDVVFSRTWGSALIALASWDARSGGVIAWDGAEVRSIANEGALAQAARNESVAFGASTLAYDEDAGVLVVGGRLRGTGPLGGLVGGGLAWIDVSDPGRAPGLVGVSTGTSAIRGDHVRAAAYDPQDHRTYVALQQPCNELRLGNVGIHSVFFERGQPRFELPMLSGVRDLARVDGELWVGLRDDTDAVGCDGVEVQTGFARVDGQRAAVVPEVRGWTPGRFGVTELDVRGPHGWLVAGFRVDLFAGGDGGGILLNPALELGTSLWPEDVAWQDDRTFWVVGRTSHHAGDPAHLADTGPRGAARVVLNEGGSIASVTHYVRRDRDGTPGVITGLPSAEVYDVLFDAEGTAFVVCGTERLMGTYDRVEREEFRLDGQLRRGGVARIEDDGSITVVAGPGVVPDGRAGAFAPDGTLYVLDAERGLLRQTGSGFEVVELSGVPAGSVPQTLWIGASGDLIAGFDTGAWMRLGETTRFLDGVGVVWGVEESDGLILLGTDRGLVRVAAPGVIDPGEPASSAGELPPFVGGEPPPPPPPPADGGMCLTEGQVCSASPEGCCPGLFCSSMGIVQHCAAR